MIDDPAISTGNYCDLAGDIRLHYATCGSPGAPLVLFLHGFPEFWFAWRELLPRFGAPSSREPAYFAVAPDLRGYNLSSKPSELAAYKAPALIGDVLGLATALGYQRFVLVAHDWGGALAWALAQRHPARVERLIILNSPHPVPFARALAHDPAQQSASAYMNWLRRPGSEDVLAADGGARMEQFLRAGLGGGPGADWFHGPVRDAYHAAWAQPGALAGGINYYRVTPLYPPLPDDPGTTRLALRPEDFRVEVPTLVIWGEADVALLPSVIDGLDAVVSNLRIERLPSASHWLVHEQPAQIERLIRDFIDDAAGPAG